MTDSKRGCFGSQAVAQRLPRERLLLSAYQPLRISLDQNFVLSVCFRLKQPFSDSVMSGWYRPEAAIRVLWDRRHWYLSSTSDTSRRLYLDFGCVAAPRMSRSSRLPGRSERYPSRRRPDHQIRCRGNDSRFAAIFYSHSDD